MELPKYITIAPVTPKGKWLVARQGAGRHHYVVGECHTAVAAEAITDALNNDCADIPEAKAAA